MKKVFLSIALAVVSMVMFGQTRGFSFQGIARDASGSIFSTAKLDLTISLLNGNTEVYSETQSSSTDAYGVFSVIIGAGKAESGSVAFADVDFSQQLNVQIDVSVNSGPVTTLANYALQAVPYAKQSENATRAGIADSSVVAGRATKAVSATKADNGVPAGTMLAWAGPESTIPAGYLACYGQAVSRTQYADLYKAIGTVWGAGDGSSTFNLPYTAGQFLRGSDLGRAEDPDAGTRTAKYNGGAKGIYTGSYQEDTLQSHQHTYLTYGTVSIGAGTSPLPIPYQLMAPKSDPAGGKETRPKNINVEYIIKY
jgi:microcystin-dependent protein